MADTNTQNTSAPEITQTNFLQGTDTNKETLYQDLFQQNDEGELVRKVKTERSGLEIFTNIMSFVTPIIVILAILGGVHAYIRSQETNTFAENLPFLCWYLNYDINASDEKKACKTAKIIWSEYERETTTLKKEIADKLAVYIPIKISSASGSSKEEAFIKETYNDKINFNAIMDQFNAVINTAKSPLIEGNILCKNVNISKGNSLSIQCDVYGGEIGIVDNTQTLGSARAEATRFIEQLSNTPESHFIVQNPPTSLAIEVIKPSENSSLPAYFKTKTTVNLTVEYIPFTSQI